MSYIFFVLFGTAAYAALRARLETMRGRNVW